jgi:hypothetical protein
MNSLTNWTLENKYLLHPSLEDSTVNGTMNVANNYGKGLLIMSIIMSMSRKSPPQDSIPGPSSP